MPILADYYNENKDYYKGASLNDVAQDVFSRAEKPDGQTFEQWSEITGVNKELKTEQPPEPVRRNLGTAPQEDTTNPLLAIPRSGLVAASDIVGAGGGLLRHFGETSERKQQEIKDAFGTLLRDGAAKPQTTQPLRPEPEPTTLFGMAKKGMGYTVKKGGEGLKYLRDTEAAKWYSSVMAQQRLKEASSSKTKSPNPMYNLVGDIFNIGSDALKNLGESDISKWNADLKGNNTFRNEVTPQIQRLIKKGDDKSLKTALNLLEKGEGWVERSKLKETGMNKIADFGTGIHEATQKFSDYVRPVTREGSALRYVTGAIESVIPSLLIGTGVTVLTKNPQLGLASMFPQVYGSTYAAERAEGKSTTEARMTGVVNASLEVLSEGVPLGIITKKGGKFVTKTIKAGTAEGIQEFLNEAMQIAYAEGIIGDDTPPEEIGQRLIDAGIMGTIGGGGASMMFDVASKLNKKQNIDPDKTDDDNNPDNPNSFQNSYKGKQAIEQKKALIDTIIETDDIANFEKVLSSRVLDEADIKKIKKQAGPNLSSAIDEIIETGKKQSNFASMISESIETGTDINGVEFSQEKAETLIQMGTENGLLTETLLNELKTAYPQIAEVVDNLLQDMTQTEQAEQGEFVLRGEPDTAARAAEVFEAQPSQSPAADSHQFFEDKGIVDLSENEKQFEKNPLDAESNTDYLDKYNAAYFDKYIKKANLTETTNELTVANQPSLVPEEQVATGQEVVEPSALPQTRNIETIKADIAQAEEGQTSVLYRELADAMDAAKGQGGKEVNKEISKTKEEPTDQPKTLKGLAAAIIDGKIKGNEDQIIVDWVTASNTGMPDDVIDGKIDTAVRNFNQTKQTILRERAKATAKTKEVTPEATAKKEEPLYKKHEVTLKRYLEEIELATPGKRIRTTDDKAYGPVEETWASQPSTFPEWFKNNGWSKAEAIKAIKKGLEGQEFKDTRSGKGQGSIWQAALDAAENERSQGLNDFSAYLEKNPESVANITAEEYQEVLAFNEERNTPNDKIIEAAKTYRKDVQKELKKEIDKKTPIPKDKDFVEAPKETSITKEEQKEAKKLFKKEEQPIKAERRATDTLKANKAETKYQEEISSYNAKLDELEKTGKWTDGKGTHTIDELKFPPVPEGVRDEWLDKKISETKRQKIDDMSKQDFIKAILTDDLTGLGNKRAYDRSKKKKVQISIDIDNLKTVNDRLGHAAGDKLIVFFSKALIASEYNTADIARLGGDEFVIQTNDAENIDKHINKVYNYIKANELIFDGIQAKVSFSSGKGETYYEAEKRLQRDKTRRTINGERKLVPKAESKGRVLDNGNRKIRGDDTGRNVRQESKRSIDNRRGGLPGTKIAYDKKNAINPPKNRRAADLLRPNAAELIFAEKIKQYEAALQELENNIPEHGKDAFWTDENGNKLSIKDLTLPKKEIVENTEVRDEFLDGLAAEEKATKLDQLSREELTELLYTDPLTGLKSKRAYEDSQKKKIQISLDADGLKYVNDVYGHEAGNDFLRSWAKALKEASGLDIKTISRVGGDEIIPQADSLKQAREAVKKTREYLDKHRLKLPTLDGSEKFMIIKFSHGIGTTLFEAEQKLRHEKIERFLSGDRVARGETPDIEGESYVEGTETKKSEVRDSGRQIRDATSQETTGKVPKWPSVISSRRRQYLSPTTHIKNNGDAAAFADYNLSKHPQERLVALLVDKDGKILGAHRFSVGDVNSAAVHNGIIAGQALNTKGVREVIVIHNHPSGNAKLSNNDIDVINGLGNLLSETHINSKTIIAVAGGKYSVNDGAGVQDVPTIKEAKHRVPAFIRVFEESGENLKTVSISKDAIEVGEELLPEGGLMFFNTANKIVGTMRVGDYSKLRGSTATEILKQLEASNATKIIAYDPTRPLTTFEAKNLDNFANAAQIKLLDIITNGVSANMEGTMPIGNETIYFSTKPATILGIEDIQSKWRGKGVDVFFNENNKRIEVNTIIVPKNQSNQGIGTKILNDIVVYADSIGKRVEVDPAVKGDFGRVTSRARLIKFYKRFGFVENKGRKKDYTTRNYMYRSPQNKVQYSTATTKPQNTITRKDIKQIFARMKNVAVGKDKDGNIWFKPVGREKITIHEVDHINGYINTSAGRIPVGSFLRTDIEVKTGGEGATADTETLWHEIVHFLETNGILSKNDINTVNEAIRESQGIKATAEHRADYLGSRLATWQKEKMSVRLVLKKVVNFITTIRDFLSKSQHQVRTVQDILGDIYSGKILKGKKEASGVNEFAQAISFSLKKAAKAVTDNPNFKKWFGDSKILNEDGSPKIMYHGTNEDFTEFNPEYAAQGVFWFSSDKAKIEKGESGAVSSKNIISVYLSAQKLAGWNEYEKYGLQEIKEKGFDGIKLDDDYIMFEPTQIKSIYNTGAFDPSNPDIRYQMAGEKAIGADKGALAKAQKMLTEGKDKKEVWKETGWLKGVEGEWKFEIDDSEAKINKFKDTSYRVALETILDHPKLYNAYPELREIPFTVFAPTTNQDSRGSYSEGEGILLNFEHISDAKDIIFHEVQHIIQGIENFARGGSANVFIKENVNEAEAILTQIKDINKKLREAQGTPEYNELLEERSVLSKEHTAKTGIWGEGAQERGYESYKKLAGEIEARDTPTRSDLTEKQRREQFPYESQGIPEDQWIITKGKGTSFNVEKQEDTKQFQTKPDSTKEWAEEMMKTYAERQQKKDAWLMRERSVEEKAERPTLKKTTELAKRFNLFPSEAARAIITRHFNDAMWWVVDKNRPIATVQSFLDKVTDNINVFLKETQRPKRTAARIQTMWAEEIKPLIEKMAKYNINVEDLEAYKHALHAQEANNALKRSNAKLQVEKIIKVLEASKEKQKIDDIRKFTKGLKTPNEWFSALNDIITKYGSEKVLRKTITSWNDFSSKPSGMTNEEARDILQEYKGDKKIKELGQMVDSLNKNSLELLYNSGQMPLEEYEAILNKYDHYVPLYREGFDDRLFGAAKGLKPSGRAIKTRSGSTRNVVDIIAHSITNYEKAITIAEKAHSQRALLGLIQANPESDIISIGAVKKSSRHDANGNLRLYPDMFDVQPNEMRLMVDGEQYIVTVQTDNADAMLMMRTLKAEDSMTGPIINQLAKVNRFLAKINTTWSPEFIVSNFIRDIQTAGINIKDTGVKGKSMLGGARKAWGAIYAIERGNPKGTELEAYYERFKAAGGKIGWADVHSSVENLGKKIKTEISLAKGERPILKTIIAGGQLIEDMNTSIENGIRLHVFKLAVEQGKTDERAAQIASDLTVDFTKKGAAGPVINSLYLFANAGIQGSYRIFRAGAKSPAVRKHMAGIIGASFLIGVLNAFAGGVDDDGEDYYNKIDNYVRERNMIIMLPNTKGKYIKIPLPWGYNVFWNFGAEISRAFSQKNYDPLASAGRVASTFFNAFNPVAAGTLMQTLSPTIADPFVQIAENKNWFGGELMPGVNKFDRTPEPDSQRYWKSASSPSQWITSQLNDITGGDKVKAGKLDFSPETLDLFVDTIGGSAFKFIKDTFDIPIKAIHDEEIKMHKIPFVRKVFSEKSEWADSRIFYENINDVLVAKERLKAYRGTIEYPKLSKELRPQLSLTGFASDSERRLKQWRQRLKQAEIAGNKTAIKNINENIKRIYVTFNKVYNKNIKE